MNMLSKVFLLSFIAMNLSYGMDKTPEQKLFEKNMAKLNVPLTRFVNDFATWSKEEQDKIDIFMGKKSDIICITDPIAAAGKYNGDIEAWLLSQGMRESFDPFLSVLIYLKEQKK